MMYRTVTVRPKLIGGVIKCNARLIKGTVDGSADLVTKITHYHTDLPEYEGATEVTPTNEVQILETRNTSVRENITINPIPSNYGRISWDGRRLLVE